VPAALNGRESALGSAASSPIEGRAHEQHVVESIEHGAADRISAGGSSVATGSAPRRMSTRSQHGIVKPKIYTNGSIHYSFLAPQVSHRLWRKH
jgi:hypothetical protein